MDPIAGGCISGAARRYCHRGATATRPRRRCRQPQVVERAAGQARGGAAPQIAGAPYEPEYYIIEPVSPDVVYVPIYDPYAVYGVWPYPAYRPFYWCPPGYVAVGVLAFGAPIVVGAALWATYDWRARRVAIDVNRFNTFNRTTLASRTWQHNPNHRGNLPYSNPALQQQFRRTATGVQGGLPKTGIGSQGLPKTGIGSQGLPKGGIATNPQLLPKGATTKTGPGNTNVNRSSNLGNAKSLNAVNPNLNKNVNRNVGGNANVNQNVGGNVNVNRNVGGNANVNRNVGGNANVNRNVGGNVNVNRHVGGNVNLNRNAPLPKGNVQGAAKGARPKGHP